MEVNIVSSRYIERLLSNWHEQEVKYCHWKSTDHLEEALDGRTDLDILVGLHSALRAEQCIIASGFVPMHTAVLRSYPGVHDYIAYDEELDRFIHLHLHYQLVMGDRWVKAYRLPVERGVLQRRVWLSSQQTWAVSPSDELLIYCARMCVKFRRPFVRPRVQEELSYFCARASSSDLDATVSQDYRPALLEVAKLALAGDQSVLEGRSRIVRQEMSAFLRMSKLAFLARSYMRLAYRVVVEVARRKLMVQSFGRRRLARGGVTVAFVGMDGAGKTSAIERNREFLAKQVDVSTVFVGSGKSGAPWYRRVAFALFGSKATFKAKAGTVGVAAASKRYPFYYLLWQWICARERCARIQEAYRSRSSGRLVLVDRWPQDTVLGSFDGPKLAHTADTFFAARARAAERETCNRAKEVAPDLVLRFVVSPAVARMRKPGELSEEQAEAARDDLLKIEWPAATTVVDINADEAAAQVDVAVRKAIWRKLGGDHP